MAGRGSWLLVVAAPCWIASCNAIWGVDELTYGGGGGEAGASGADTTTTATSSTTTTSTGTGGTGTTSDPSGGSGGGGLQPDCTPNTERDVGDCERCGDLIERCNASGAWGAAACEGQGECEVGDTEPSDCADCEQRVCSATCSWGGCVHIAGCCTPNCERAVCGGDDGCGGTCHGDHNDPCSAPAETWRCVWIDYFDTWGSQVCRSGHWVTYHLDPRNCDACCGAFSSSCCASSGCT